MNNSLRRRVENLLVWCGDLIKPSPSMQPKPWVSYWREYLTNGLLLLALFASLISTAYFLAELFPSASWLLKLWRSLILACSLIAFSFHRKIKFKIKIFILYGIAYFGGLYYLCAFDDSNIGMFMFFAVPIIAVLLQGRNAALITLMINGLFMILAALLISADVIAIKKFAGFQVFSSWIFIGNFMLINGALTLPLIYLIEKFQSTIEHENKILQLLDIERDRLFQAKEKAEQADQLKTSFLGNISHELRTPLNAIMGFSEILREKEVEKKELKDYLSIIEENGSHLLRMINDIIEIAKIQSGDLRIKKKHCSIEYVVEDLYHLFKAKNYFAKKDIKIKLYTDPRLNGTVCYADENKIRKILSNLIDNALKFTHSGSVNFGYELINEYEILFFVEDTGIGIDYDSQKIIFDPFRQLEHYSTKSYPGTGLGLAISQGLCKMLGSKLNVKSIPAEGTRFSFKLKYHPSELSLSKYLIEEFDNIKKQCLSKKIMMLIEEDEITKIYVERILKPTGIDIFHVENFSEGWELIESGINFDIVLMNLRESHSEIKDFLNNISFLPIILHSGYRYAGDDDLSNLADYVISRPLDKDNLFYAIRQVLELQKV
jgi:signal transduction histidine kinase